MVASPKERQAPQHFGKFEILQELSRGQMGIVYKAKDTSLSRLVALKVIFEETLPPSTTKHGSTVEGLPFQLQEQESVEIRVERFRKEAQAVASLKHPHIVSLFEWGVYEDMHYFSMEFIDGDNLFQKASKLMLRDIVRIFVKMAYALHYAHTQGIVHRDVKPQNILLDRQNIPYLNDFGLAKNQQNEGHLTKSGIVFGTPAYMAPEQARGEMKSIDGRADIYSLGASLYELLSGSKPFSGESGIQILLKAIQEEPKPLRELNPNLPPALELICQKAMAKDREERYQTAEEMAKDLEAYLQFQPIDAQLPQKLPVRIKRNPLLSTLYLTMTQILLFVILYGGWWFLFVEPSSGDWILYETATQGNYFKVLKGEAFFEPPCFRMNGQSHEPVWQVRAQDRLLNEKMGIRFELQFLEQSAPSFRFFFNAQADPAQMFSTGYQLVLQGDFLSISKSSSKIPWIEYALFPPQEYAKFLIEHLDRRIRVYVNGELYLDVEDFYPDSQTEGVFGFETSSSLKLYKFKIWKYNNPAQISSMSLGDHAFYREKYQDAYEEYGRLLENPQFQESLERLRYQRQLCLYQQESPEIGALLQELSQIRKKCADLSFHDSRWLLRIQLNYFYLYLYLFEKQDFANAFRYWEMEMSQQLGSGNPFRFYHLFLRYLESLSEEQFEKQYLLFQESLAPFFRLIFKQKIKPFSLFQERSKNLLKRMIHWSKKQKSASSFELQLSQCYHELSKE
jgi:serine/threonine protein kinase